MPHRHTVIRDGSRIRMFMTGPGGSGKSHVIKHVMNYCRRFCEMIQYPFTRHTILVTALTGVAAVSIGGETLHGASKIGVGRGKGMSQQTIQDKREEWEETRMIIVDEVSFATRALIEKLHEHCCTFKHKETDDEFFGGLTVLFAGDFRQLEPPSNSASTENAPIYRHRDFRVWRDGVNVFVPLKGSHRFDCLHWSRILRQLRNGKIDDDDWKHLDARVVGSSNGPSESDIPNDVTIACATNKERTTMNNAVFKSLLKHTHTQGSPPPSNVIVIKSSSLKFKSNGRELNKRAKKMLYEECGECHCRRKSEPHKYIDPMLKLFVGQKVMLCDNTDVEHGVANGSLGRIQQVRITKQNQDKHLGTIVIDGYKLKCIDSEHVEAIEIFMTDTEQVYALKAEKLQSTVQMPLKFPGAKGTERVGTVVELLQFPVTIDHATTVHKLQGRSVRSLFVINWSYRTNWVYTALSRVKTLKGLFLRRKIDRRKNFAVPREFLQMIDHMQQKVPPTHCE